MNKPNRINNTTNFNGSYLSSGVYFYTLKAGDFTSTKKLVLMK
ncbi:MAG: T9SS type A sorting domain-containing protein [Ignavibacteriaceae bacterium]|nr:T9SS type A sorting domain-containing protein [Ignavibacteriaceae bacterium]